MKREAGKVAPVLVRKVAERACDGLLRDHFAELPHDHERDDAPYRITKNHRRTRGLQYARRTQEQTGADRPAQRD